MAEYRILLEYETLYIVQYVQCTLYSDIVQCVQCVQCTLYSDIANVYNVYNVHYTVTSYSVYNVYNVHYTVTSYNVQFTLCSVRYNSGNVMMVMPILKEVTF